MTPVESHVLEPAVPLNKTTQPSVLFASPMNLLDITSGAALSIRTLLAELVGRGYRAVAIGATLFDSTFGGEHVIQAGEQQKDKKILRATVLGVEHLILRTDQHQRIKMTTEEEERYMHLFRHEIKNRRPDLIITWGGLLLESAIMREGLEAGIPSVFYLVSANYRDITTFRHATAIMTDTQATAEIYKKRFGFHCHVVGKFIDEKLIKATQRKPEFITFINPSFEKGVNVFMPMVRIAAKEHPEIRFLVVESRGRWSTALQVFKYNQKEFPNVRIIGHQKDMRPVYASTKALLLPSTWHESGARVIAEALINHIPVVASHTGGSPELVGRGGVILQLPEKVCEKKGEPADEKTARQWLEVTAKIWNDDAYYHELVNNAKEESVQHGISSNVNRFIESMMPVILHAKNKYQENPIKPESLLPQSPFLYEKGDVTGAATLHLKNLTSSKNVIKQALEVKNRKISRNNRKKRNRS